MFTAWRIYMARKSLKILIITLSLSLATSMASARELYKAYAETPTDTQLDMNIRSTRVTHDDLPRNNKSLIRFRIGNGPINMGLPNWYRNGSYAMLGLSLGDGEVFNIAAIKVSEQIAKNMPQRIELCSGVSCEYQLRKEASVGYFLQLN